MNTNSSSSEMLSSLFSNGLKGLIFDVDGVLLDSRNSNIAYYNLIRKGIFLPPLSPEEEDFCHVASVSQALDRIVPENLRDAAHAVAERINYQEQILPMLSVEKGLLEALHWLKLWDVRLGVCTNRTRSVTDLLHYFGLESFFDPIKTAGNSRAKPEPDGLLEAIDEWGVGNEDVAFLGDSWVDQMAANAGNVPFWAFRNSGLEAQAHFNDFFELITCITPLVERK